MSLNSDSRFDDLNEKVGSSSPENLHFSPAQNGHQLFGILKKPRKFSEDYPGSKRSDFAEN